MTSLQEFVNRLTASPQYVGNRSAAALVREYLAECFNVHLGSEDNPSLYWTHTPDHLLGWREQPNMPNSGDIVIMEADATHPNGRMGIATGSQAGSYFRLLEQNGGLGSGSGMDTDAVRLTWADHNRIMGVLHPTALSKEPVKQAITNYRAAAATPAPTRTVVKNNRTGTTYRLFTDKDNKPTIVTYYVAAKGGALKLDFSKGIDSMDKTAAFESFRNAIECAGTAVSVDGIKLYMTVEDMGDLYNTWRPTNAAGFPAELLSETRPPYDATWNDLTPEEVEEPPKLEAEPLPSWLVNAMEVTHENWVMLQQVQVVDLYTMQPIGTLEAGIIKHVSHSIMKDNVQYARLVSDVPEMVVAVQAHNTKGEAVLERWPRARPNPEPLFDWRKHYMRFIDRAHDLLDAITPKEK